MHTRVTTMVATAGRGPDSRTVMLLERTTKTIFTLRETARVLRTSGPGFRVPYIGF